MLKKIRLSKEKVTVFMGSMNAMPMMYALELKKKGYDVIYIVDSPKKNILSRPENHFPDICYPYPEWILEIILPSQILLPLFPKLYARIYQKRINAITKKEIGCFVLNGFFSSLAPYLNRASSIVNLSHGSDLDVWANIDNIVILAQNFENRSIFKFLPHKLTMRLIKHIVHVQYFGYKRSNTIVYFPQEFNPNGDKVIQRLVKQGVQYVSRYDISFEPLKKQTREFKSPSGELIIFSGVRFSFKTFPDGNIGENKGNDIIIEGIAKYYLTNPNTQVHFIEKGEDVQFAKELCQKFAIDKIVVWHKEMPLKELLALYEHSDICFDQVGCHWIGAIGGYALWLGKPLIANANTAVRSGAWPKDHPICTAKNAEEVCNWLIKLQDVELRKQISESSKQFVERYMGPEMLLSRLFDFREI